MSVTFLFLKKKSKNLIIGLCNCSANSRVRSEILATQDKSKGQWSEIFSFLIPLPEVFLSKTLYTIEASSCCYLSYYGFLAILNALSPNILPEAVLLGKFLKSP